MANYRKGRIPDLSGQKVSNFTVLKFYGFTAKRDRLWMCQCLCGRKTVTREGRLLKYQTKSCGCINTGNTKHNQRRRFYTSPEYNAWSSMIARCCNSKHPAYKNYGGRGIIVCDRWLASFQVFLDDMGFRPKSTLRYSLDRINNEGNYEPSNCRWATAVQQINNRRVKRINDFSDQEIQKEFIKRNLTH